MNYFKFLFLIITVLPLSGHCYIKGEGNSEPLPVEDFFRHAKYINVKISPDSKKLAYSFRDGNQVKLAILSRQSNKVIQTFSFGAWRQVTHFDWANNQRIIMSVQKKVGKYDKKGGKKVLYAANFDSSSKKKIFLSEGSSYKIVSLLKKDPRNIIILKTYDALKKSETLANKVVAVKLNIYTGRSRRLSGQPKAPVSNILFDSNDQMQVATQYIPDHKKFGFGEYFVFIKEQSSGIWRRSSILNYSGAKLEFTGISDDGHSVYGVTDLNAKNTGFYSFNLASGSRTRLFQDANVDIGQMIYSADNKVIGFNYSPDFNQVKFIAPEHRESKALTNLFLKFPGQDIRFTSYTENADEAVILVSSDKNSGKFYLYNFKGDQVKHLLSARPWLDANKMVEMQPIKYTSRDGLEIYGYLTLPQGKAKNLPLIVLPHGGPHAHRDYWQFNPEVQFLANRGYAVLQMNFRGSGGYGQAFEMMGYRQWGRKMQDDVTDATYWAINNGVADPKRICIFGGSYGGYAALMGVIREPQLYRCAIGYVGVYDLEDHFIHGDIISTSAGLAYIRHVLGEDKAEWHKNSPAKNVDKIKANLFIAHGTQDVRVPMSQYELLKEALVKINKPFMSMLRDDGHGYTKIENRLDFYNALEEFLATNLN